MCLENTGLSIVRVAAENLSSSDRTTTTSQSQHSGAGLVRLRRVCRHQKKNKKKQKNKM